MRIQFVSQHHPRLFFRQTPNYDGEWKNLQFQIDDSTDASWLVVYDTPNEFSTIVPKERRILFATEPFKTYNPKYINQFGILVCPQPKKDFHGTYIQSHCALPWHIGKGDESRDDWQYKAMGIQQLKDYHLPKIIDLSAICSNLTELEEHRQRLNFLRSLKYYMGNRLVWYGKGVTPITDKLEILFQSKYTIVLENTLDDHAWTEKIIDAFIAKCFVFYSGPKNLHDYFDKDSFEYINTKDLHYSMHTIECVMAKHSFQRHIDSIEKNREFAFSKHNFFNVVSYIIESQKSEAVQNARNVIDTIAIN